LVWIDTFVQWIRHRAPANLPFVLVDAMTTVAEAEALADWVAPHNRNLKTIYMMYGHFLEDFE